MPHDLADLFAELDDAKASLGRTVKKCRVRIARGRAALEAAALADRQGRLFEWSEPRDR